jgi:hypothetical protein
MLQCVELYYGVLLTLVTLHIVLLYTNFLYELTLVTLHYTNFWYELTYYIVLHCVTLH